MVRVTRVPAIPLGALAYLEGTIDDGDVWVREDLLSTEAAQLVERIINIGIAYTMQLPRPADVRPRAV